MTLSSGGLEPGHGAGREVEAAWGPWRLPGGSAEMVSDLRSDPSQPRVWRGLLAVGCIPQQQGADTGLVMPFLVNSQEPRSRRCVEPHSSIWGRRSPQSCEVSPDHTIHVSLGLNLGSEENWGVRAMEADVPLPGSLGCSGSGDLGVS